MPFRDKYTTFWFNDISSETMKVWVTNNKDIEFKATPNFTDTFVNPVASQIRYHTNTTISSNDFQVKCIAIGINLLEWRAIENWLSPLSKGKLHFDFNQNTYYEVKVSKMVKGSSFIAGANHILNEDTYNVEFTIEFTTTSDWAALGPQVVVPINETFTEKDKVVLVLVDRPDGCAVSQAFFNADYNDMTSNPENWNNANWWSNKLLSTEPSSTTLKTFLSGSQKDAMVACLKSSLESHQIVTLSSTVNNKFGMPAIYNLSKSINTTIPSKDAITVDAAKQRGRKYITQPTLLVNKTLYLDEEFYAKMSSDTGGNISYSNYNYYLLDGSVTTSEQLTNVKNYSVLLPNQIGYIRHQETVSGESQMVFSNPSDDNVYGILTNTAVTEDGLTLYGMSVLFTASSEAAFQHCPFYYLEDESTYAIMNAGAYDSYPDLYLDLGLTIETAVKKEGELLYQYDVAVQNVTLGVDGRTGFVTFNNLLADSATLTGSGGQTKLVEQSINNGIFNIPSGNPELLKVRIFGITKPAFKVKKDGVEKVEDIKVVQIFFQPVGEFKYPRNGKFAALLFSSIGKEAVYNSGFYPLVSSNFVNADLYGSRINNYLFSANCMLSYNQISAGSNMWVLTIPEADFIGCTLCDMSKVGEDGSVTKPPYMYLSLCDYTEASIATDTSMASYALLQTRDVF